MKTLDQICDAALARLTVARKIEADTPEGRHALADLLALRDCLEALQGVKAERAGGGDVPAPALSLILAGLEVLSPAERSRLGRRLGVASPWERDLASDDLLARAQALASVLSELAAEVGVALPGNPG